MQDLTAPRPPGNVAYRVVLLAAALIVGGLLFQQLATFLLAIFITIIVAIPLAACATRLERVGVPRWLGALAGLLGGLVVLAGVLALVIPSFVDQVQAAVDAVPVIIDDLRGRFAEATGAKDSAGTDVQQYLQGFLDKPDKLVGPLTSIGIGVAGALGSIVLVLMTAYYVAVNPRPLVDGVLRLFPPPRRTWAEQVGDRLRRAYIGWMRGVIADMAVTFVLLYVGLSIVGLDFALAFSVLSALLVVIPYFGSIIGGIPPVLFALADSPTKALIVLAVYVAVQQLEGNVIIPLVMSRTLKLHPAVIAIGVVVVGKLFGYVGLFVAVPILSTIIVLTEEIWVRGVEAQEERRQPEGLELPSTAVPEEPPRSTALAGG